MSIEKASHGEAHIDLRGMIGAVLSAIATFAGVIGFSQELKLLLIVSIALLWLAFVITIRINKLFVQKIFSQFFNKKDWDPAEYNLFIRRVHFTALSVMAAIGLAGFIKNLENRLTPDPSYAESIYYMIVLDASEDMNLPYEGSRSRWEAMQNAVDHFLKHSHKKSNYGLVSIGGQNSNETGDDPCDVPTTPLIPLVSKNGMLRAEEDISLANFQAVVSLQKPQGGGSLSEAFSLAKNELLNLPSDPKTKRIIILIVSASDHCTGKIDWRSLRQEVELVNKEIAVHEEFILMDDSPDPEVVEFAAQLNQMAAPDHESNSYVQVVYNYDQLIISINNIINRLEGDTVLPASESATAGINPSPTVCCLPTPDKIATTTKIRKTEQMPTLHIITVTPTTCSSVLPDLTTVIPLPGSFCTATPTLTPSATITPSFTIIPTTIIYPTAKPTRDRSNNQRPPQPTKQVCCKICGPNSKACGDSCIELTDNCTKKGGCACEG